MNSTLISSLRLLAAGLALATATSAALSAPAPILVCYPGGPVSEAEANTAMASMLRVVERIGQWPANSFTSSFTTAADTCRSQLDQLKPAFAITSLGLFLEQRDAHHLVPVAQPRMKGATSERYRLLVQKGKYGRLDELKGKAIGGTVLEEPDFLQRIVFAGKLDPRSAFELKPSRQAIRALRALDKGELDAVLVNGQQFAALGSLPLQNPMEAIYTSGDIPLMGMVADSQASSASERERLARALQGMCGDSEGKKLCELFGIEAFVPASPGAIEPMITLWKQER